MHSLSDQAIFTDARQVFVKFEAHNVNSVEMAQVKDAPAHTTVFEITVTLST